MGSLFFRRAKESLSSPPVFITDTAKIARYRLLLLSAYECHYTAGIVVQPFCLRLKCVITSYYTVQDAQVW